MLIPCDADFKAFENWNTAPEAAQRIKIKKVKIQLQAEAF